LDVHIVFILEIIKAHKILSRKPNGDGLLGDLAVDGRKMLRTDVREVRCKRVNGST
jgi:hypothetical protein